ncbi:uncharacterized protein PODANS_3_3260 [Podospora anserina S mat+]|uniref:Podospora anserina S mat+ genomic DNA chromosome 3, supercontig 2 n=1 Tax=Podospora anserina (strain S / ATCC MYA-4624 / DSM 980 / FGSC 10383) TaxID=515849 RepID=B2AZC7_PODAN|nr:uncharacterized protein PODANS_3_3260 [Podospora anserina S mat+]CAP70241.1 unnamed protein product [Podospora anserina S mat+]CDP26834.1 Putative protein of unknown function [Podospora anserina S mat+]
MSGLEVAGVVLGTFPLIIDGGKLVRGYLQMTKFWWKFSSQFPDFISAVEDELIAFRQNVELLLRPLALDAATESDLLNNAHSRGWHDSKLRSMLKARLGREKLIHIPRSGTVDFAILRLAVSFTKKRDLMKEVTTINTQISRFLEADLRIAQATLLAPAIMGKEEWKACLAATAPYLDMQSKTAQLYRAFRPESWLCRCQTLHPCGIATVWFDHHAKQPGRGAINLFLGSNEPPNMPVEVGVEVSAGVDSTCDGSGNAEPLFDQVADLTARIRLDAGFEMHVKAGKQQNSTVLALSSFQTAVNPRQSIIDPIWMPRKTAKLAKPDSAQRHAVPKLPEAASPVPKKLRVGCNLLKNPISVLEQHGDTIHYEDNTITLSAKRQHPSETESSLKSSIQTLVDFRKPASLLLSERIRIGIKLAYTILGLGTSAWIPQAWDDRDVQVVRNTPPKVYFNHTSIRSALERQVSNAREHAQMTIFTLGTTLLQLLFQERIEDQPYYKAHCNSDGSANDWTHWRAAQEWQEEVEMTHGPELADVIARCVGVNFVDTPDLGKAEFVQEVLISVIEPLEKYVKHF